MTFFIFCLWLVPFDFNNHYKASEIIPEQTKVKTKAPIANETSHKVLFLIENQFNYVANARSKTRSKMMKHNST